MLLLSQNPCRSDFIRCIYGVYTVSRGTPYVDKSLYFLALRTPYTDYTDFLEQIPLFAKKKRKNISFPALSRV